MTYVDWHRGIRKAYPDALLSISGDTLDELVVINQETGQPFLFDSALAEAAYREVASEQALKSLRNQRNRLLTETDYLALSDQTLTAEMAAYRQALRDLPANTVDPANPVWPTKPGA